MNRSDCCEFHFEDGQMIPASPVFEMLVDGDLYYRACIDCLTGALIWGGDIRVRVDFTTRKEMPCNSTVNS